MTGTKYEFHPLANAFPLMVRGRFARFVEDIRLNGLRVPISLYEGKILDGRNRYRACEELGIEAVVVPWEPANSDTPWHFVKSMNLARRHLNESQRAMVAARLANWQFGQNQYTEGGPIGLPTTQEEAAAELNVGTTSLKRAKTVMAGPEELREVVDDGLVAVSKAAQWVENFEAPDFDEILGALRATEGTDNPATEAEARRKANGIAIALARARADAKLSKDTGEGLGPFVILYADPPWQYSDSRLSIGGAEGQYPTQPLDKIQSFIKDRQIQIHEDAALFLWATVPLLPEALTVIEHWGFKYKTCVVWDKVKPNPGSYFGIRVEFLLVALRGNMRPPARQTGDNLIVAVREAHSKKPEVVHKIIEEMYPHLQPRQRLEIFARHEVLTWTTMINGKFIITEKTANGRNDERDDGCEDCSELTRPLETYPHS